MKARTSTLILHDVTRVSKHEYSIHMTNETLNRTWSFRYKNKDQSFDLRMQGDLELLLLYADEYYQDNYLYNFNL